MALVNRPAPQNVAWCGIGARAVTRATDLARRGDAAGLGAALAQAPDLLRPTYAAAIMQAAALAGRAEIVAMLLDDGIGPDHPFYLPVRVTGQAFERVIYVTPLCAARFKHRPRSSRCCWRQVPARTSSPRHSSATSPRSHGCSRPIPALPRRPIRRSTSSTSRRRARGRGRPGRRASAHPRPHRTSASRRRAGVARRGRPGQPGDGRAAAGTRRGRDTDRRRTLGPSPRARSAACQPWRGDRLLRLVDRCRLHGNQGRKDDPDYVPARCCATAPARPIAAAATT